MSPWHTVDGPEKWPVLTIAPKISSGERDVLLHCFEVMKKKKKHQSIKCRISNPITWKENQECTRVI